MKKFLLLTLLTALCAGSGQARPREYKEPRVRFGIGYRQSLALREQLAIKTDYGKNARWYSPEYIRGGELLLEGTVRINSNWNTGLGIGFGSYGRRSATANKVYAKAERLYGRRASRWFNYANAGATLGARCSPGLTIELGGGYRMAMTRRTRLDITAGLEYLNMTEGVTVFNEDGTDSYYPHGARFNRFGFTVGIAMHF